jgi:hypothetical protein
MATNASTRIQIHSAPLFVSSATTAKQPKIPNWEQLDPSTRQDLLALLTQMISQQLPRSCASDERGLPDESA